MPLLVQVMAAYVSVLVLALALVPESAALLASELALVSLLALVLQFSLKVLPDSALVWVLALGPELALVLSPLEVV